MINFDWIILKPSWLNDFGCWCQKFMFVMNMFYFCLSWKYKMTTLHYSDVDNQKAKYIGLSKQECKR
jgi:hypothetical protein